MVAMLLLSLRSNAGSFEPSLMLTSSCKRNSSRSVMRKRCHIYWRLVICIVPLSLKQLQCVLVKPYIPSTKAVSPRETSHKSLLHSALTPPIHAMTTALHRMPSARAVLKKVPGMPSATALVMPANNPLSLNELRRPPIIDTMEGGRKLTWYKLTLRKHPDLMSCSSI